MLAAVSFGVGRSSWWTAVNWALLATVSWTFGLVGLAVLRWRPDLARRPRRPSTPLATAVIVTAGLTAVGGVIAFEVLAPDRAGAGLGWFTAGVAACAVLGVIAHRINDRAEASGRFAHVSNRPGQTA